MSTDNTVAMIDVDKIHILENVNLRDVKRGEQAFEELTDSIRQQGITNSLGVRPSKDHEGEYDLIDGLQRFTIANDLGYEQVPCIVMDKDDVDFLITQIAANHHRITTRPAEFGNQMMRIMGTRPDLTKKDVADMVSMSTTTLDKYLQLNKLLPEIQEKVDEGAIKLLNAVALSKLPETEQPEWVSRAIKEEARTFVPDCKKRAQEIRNEKNKGNDNTKREWQPSRSAQKLKVLKEEYAILHGEEEGDSQVLAAFKAADIEPDLEQVKLVIAWTLNVDPVNAERQRKDEEARVKRVEEEKARRKKEREEKKEAEAAAAEATVADALMR